LEGFCIEQYESWKREKGYNLKRHIDKRWVITEEIREKLKQINSGKKVSQETRKKMSESHKGKNAGEKNGMFGRFGEKHSRFGKHHNQKAKEKMSKNHADFSNEKNPQSKFTWILISEIREKYASGNYTQKQLAKEYGAGLATIWRIINNITWKTSISGE
jgi:hypothetical protein